MNKTELMQAIIQKHEEIIAYCYTVYPILKQFNDNNGFTERLSDLKKQLAECKEDVNFTKDDIDLAYCAGIWNTGGIDVLRKELERLKHIGRKPHQIFQRYKPIKTE